MIFKRSINLKTNYHRIRYFFTQLSINTNSSIFEHQNMSKKRPRSLLAQNSIIRSLIARLQTTENQLDNMKSEITNIKIGLLQLAEMPNDEVDNNPDSSKKAFYEFKEENGFVVVFTDGACENNGKPNAKAGIGVWFGRNHALNISKPVEGRATNNTAEIQACVHAVKTAHANGTISIIDGVKKLKIKTDSEFVINSMTKWIFKWRTNNWKVAGGGDVKNKDDFVILHNALKLMDQVAWEHVDAHKGIEGNEDADSLAKAGALLYRN